MSQAAPVEDSPAAIALNTVISDVKAFNGTCLKALHNAFAETFADTAAHVKVDSYEVDAYSVITASLSKDDRENLAVDAIASIAYASAINGSGMEKLRTLRALAFSKVSKKGKGKAASPVLSDAAHKSARGALYVALLTIEETCADAYARPHKEVSLEDRKAAARLYAQACVSGWHAAVSQAASEKAAATAPATPPAADAGAATDTDTDTDEGINWKGRALAARARTKRVISIAHAARATAREAAADAESLKAEIAALRATAAAAAAAAAATPRKAHNTPILA
jgi:hypothetical protein